jgi:hypothetical protein
MNRGCLPSNGNLPREERQVKKGQIVLVMIGAATLKKKGSVT